MSLTCPISILSFKHAKYPSPFYFMLLHDGIVTKMGGKFWPLGRWGFGTSWRSDEPKCL